MGWGSGTNAAGREVGYLVEATCDGDGCEVEIDHGLAFVCGGEHDGGEDGCGGYFCEMHLYHAYNADESVSSGQLCWTCSNRWEEAHGD